MQVLSENLAEGSHPAAEPVELIAKSSFVVKESSSKKRPPLPAPEQQKPHASLRFSLTMDNLIINLFRRDDDEVNLLILFTLFKLYSCNISNI